TQLQKSPIRLIAILLCCLVIWGGLFTLAYIGFREFKVRWSLNIYEELMGLLFSVMFFVLTVLLIFSSGIILYSSLFASAEAGCLVRAPLAGDQIFAFKFQGAVAFSSWAFLLLATPILIAYGLVVRDGAPWYFYAFLPLFFFGFVLLPGALGAFLGLFLVNF